MSENDRPDPEKEHEVDAALDAEAPSAERADHRPSDNGPSDPDETGRTEAGQEPDEAGGEAPGSVDAEVQRLTDALARTQAEMVNHERRLEREMEKTRKFALERVMRDFIPVLDSLDQALAASSDDGAGNAQEGLVLTRKLALKALESHGLETLHPEGQRFDANWHEAMTAAPTDEAEPDTVLQVLQTGYALHGRLLRPARVIVAKAP